MSTLSVTNIQTANASENLTITTGNTTGSKIVVSTTNGMTFYSNSSANAGYVDGNGVFGVTTKLEVGSHTLGGYDFGDLAAIEIDLNANTYLQIVAQNANTGNNASSDLVVTNDQGNDTVNFVDLGINGSGYNQAAFNIGGPGDGYLYASNGSLAIGTANATVSNLKFHTGGTTSTSERMRITAGGNVGIGNTAPDAKLAVTGTANISGNIVIGGVATVSGNLNVTGLANVTANANLLASANVSGNLNVTGSANVSTNTFFLGTSTNAASGYTILPNQIKMNWGVCVPNSFGQNTVSFVSPFTTNAYTVSLSIRTSVANPQAANAKIITFSTINSSAIVISASNSTANTNTGILGVHYLAIGPA